MSNSKFDYDLLIVGGGSGGLAAAKRAASYGVKVAIAEESKLGGTCVNRGCIAKRLMVYAADYPRHFEAAKSYGWSAIDSQFDWSTFAKAMRQQTKHLSQNQQQSLQDAGIDILADRASFIDAHTLQVGKREVSASHILIAVGGEPNIPNVPGSELMLTSDDMFTLPQLPKRLAILGGGYIGVEFSSVLCGLGCDVTVIEAHDRILAGFDSDLRLRVQQGLEKRGIKVLTETTVKAIERSGEEFRLFLEGDNLEGNAPDLVVDRVLCAIGRRPKLAELALDGAGVAVKDGAIAVDRFSRTSQDHIFAIGDCTDRLALTPVARAEGQAVVETLFNQPAQVDYDWVPSAVCTRPEAASVGMTEDQAREQFGDAIECHRKEFSTLFYSLTTFGEKILLKLVVNRDTDRVLGVHMVGDRAAEIVQTLTIAVKSGITRTQLHNTIGIHPTEGEELYSL